MSTPNRDEIIERAVERIWDAVIDPPYSPGHDWQKGEPLAILRDFADELERVPCPECDGTGDLSSPHIGGGNDCPTCHGTGTISREHKYWRDAAEWLRTTQATNATLIGIEICAEAARRFGKGE